MTAIGAVLVALAVIVLLVGSFGYTETRPLLRAERYNAARLPLSLIVALDTDCKDTCSVANAPMTAGDADSVEAAL